MSQPYADTHELYSLAGWPAVLPLPPGQKFSPPTGFTGAAGADPTPEQRAQWAVENPGGNICLRMPDGVIGIDVDHYDKLKGDGSVVQKRGGDLIAELEERLGPLPPTWVSSAREAPSGIRLYRVPPGRYATNLGDAIEVPQRHHRYVVCWPSTNPDDNGRPYRWSWWDGEKMVASGSGWGEAGFVPRLDELPWLPPAWVDYLREGATVESTPLGEWSAGQELLSTLQTDGRAMCFEMSASAARSLKRMRNSTEGSRHDAMISAVHDLIHMGAKGHTGAGPALADLVELWAELVPPDRMEELERALISSARKAVTAWAAGGHQPPDPCLIGQGAHSVSAGQSNFSGVDGTVPLQVPDELGRLEAPPMSVAPAALAPATVRGFIGVQEFDPQGGLDQVLAEAVLERLHPAVRFGADVGAWLVRRADRWEQIGASEAAVAGWAVAQLAQMMPPGDPDAEKDTLPRQRADKYKRFMTAGPAGSIASKVRSLVSVGGTHPSSLSVKELDTDPHILWAGGVPWDLRRSLDVPRPAMWIPPDTVHLHTAAVLPADVPTPRWDAYLAAVWPDEEIRAWALRVLSIAVTGEADRSLPLLVGEGGRGKTATVALLMSLLGTYAHAADPRLLSGVDKAHASIVYDLKGRRLSFIDEGPRSGDNPRERLKQLTGGGDLTGNPMRGNPITFSPSHTLILTSNNDPDVADEALRDRLRVIPCDGDPEAVAAARRAITSEAWQQEAPGVLAMFMREAGAWLADRDTARNWNAPASIQAAVAELAEEQDMVRNWLEERCTPSDQGQRSTELYQNFVDWCRQMGFRNVMNTTRWGRELTDLGYPSKDGRQGGWVGKVRALVLRMPGGWGPAGGPPPSTGVVAGSTAVVAGMLRVQEATRNRGEAAGQSNFSGGVVAGVAGLSSNQLNENNNNNTHTNKEQGAVFAATPATPATPSPGPAETSVATSVATPRQTRDTGNTGNKPARKPRMTPEEKAARAAERKAAAAQARAEARRQRVIESEGGYIGLPAVQRRGQAPQPVTVFEAAGELALMVTAKNELTVDVEHTGYPVGHRDHKLRTVQLGDDLASFVFDPDDEESADLVRHALRMPAALRAHSPVADLVPLESAGLIDDVRDAWERMHNTAIPAKLANPAGVQNGSDLKGLSLAVLGEHAVSPVADKARAVLFKAGGWLTDTKNDTPIERSGWAQVRPGSAVMVTYAGSDVLDTAAIAPRLTYPSAELYERERAAERIVSVASHRGVKLDGDRVVELATRVRGLADAAAERVKAFGIENPGSNDQIGAKLVELGVQLRLTDSGKPSVAKDTLLKVKALYAAESVQELVAAVLAYRKSSKALDAFLDPWDVMVKSGDGRARPTFYTLGADTGRMSCVRPNLQQVPREGGTRSCVLADDGMSLISADFKSVEVRVMAALSGDRELQRQLALGIDLHGVVAAEVFGPEFTKADRYAVKRGVFGWAYGGSIPTLSAQVGVPESTMAAVVDVLAAIAPEFVTWSEEVKGSVRKGAIEFPTYSGRTIHLDRRFPHKAPNYLIQGSAREALVDALLKWDQGPWGGGVVLPIHDEVIAFVPEDQADAALAYLCECMTMSLYGVDIVADPSTPSSYWADAA